MTQVSSYGEMPAGTDVHAMVEQWVTAWNAKDVEGLLGLYDPHAEHVSYQVNQVLAKSVATGLDEIRQVLVFHLERTPSSTVELLEVVPDAGSSKAFLLYRVTFDGGSFRAVQLWRLLGGRIIASEVFYGVRE